MSPEWTCRVRVVEIGQALVHREFARSLGADVLRSVILSETGSGQMIDAALALGLEVVVEAFEP